MPRRRTTSKQPGKLSRQLLFSEALNHQRAPPTEEHSLTPPSSMAESTQGATMDCILQEISAVGRKLEGMDSAMVSLMAETKSMQLDIAGFQKQVTGLEQRVTTVETHITSWVDRDQELLYLRSKQIDLEDRSRRDNVRFLGFLENIKGADIHSYLRETLPKLTGIIFYPPLEFQRVGLQYQTQSMDTASSIRPQDPLGPLLSVASSASAPEDTGRPTAGSHPRGRDMERLTKSYDDRDQRCRRWRCIRR
ncbi:hypothetical protein NDU88_004467 [Pleurodeles waltl]|uniref:Uncharacterized protein n=1 Tax=Pleurodeles waltl TaxID=8319 RepID=A0AAV7T7V4_PLEWA|nr:hypothetical protein NDU88_004467 [Pleurodeles waltl]